MSEKARKGKTFEPTPLEGDKRERIFNLTRFGLSADAVIDKTGYPAPRVRDTIMSLADEGRLVMGDTYKWESPDDIRAVQARREKGREAERKFWIVLAGLLLLAVYVVAVIVGW